MRSLFFLPLALPLTLGTFLLMAYLAGIGASQPIGDRGTALSIDLFRLKMDSQAELRERAPPPPPLELTPQPPAPQQKMSVDTQVNIDQPQIDIPTPKIDVGVKINAAPNISAEIAQPVTPGPIAPPAPQAVTIGKATFLKQVDAKYPRRALRRKIEGKVVFEYRIDTQGRAIAESFKVVEATPKGVFEKAAKRALLRSRYEVRYSNGKPVEYKVRQPIEFRIDK
ncbi:energy transducer TonB [Marinobacterium jannaschii]|uniref:energy transducer TonB n=1 Tax=Marinobacterium jannaschii TaxID=64970 RepID=UPI0004828946|nr:energy transducer TonB [Marinobacterium jannaschii]